MSIPRAAMHLASQMLHPIIRVGSEVLSGMNSPGLGAMRRHLVTAVLAAMAFGPAQNAMAIPVGFGLNCSVSGGVGAETGDANGTTSNSLLLSPGCGGQVTVTGEVVAKVLTDGGLTQFRFDQAADTLANARAGMGSLGVRSVSSTTSNPPDYAYQFGSVQAMTENRFGASANSLASTYWFDTFTVGGVTSPNGFVILQFSMDLHGQTSASALGANARLLSRLLLSDGNRYFSDPILSLSDAGILSTTIGFRSFSEFSLMGQLEAQSDARAGWLGTQYTSATNAAADAFNTSDFHVDVLTPGGTYSALSGHNYLTAVADPVGSVPEPGTAWLLGPALLALIGAQRRRKP